MSYYKICPYCGAALDPGERCDCKKEKAARPAGTETNGTNGLTKPTINIIAYDVKKASEKLGGEIVCVRWKKKEYPF